MINAYITGGEGVTKVELTPNVPALGEGSADEYELRKMFLKQMSYYAACSGEQRGCTSRRPGLGKNAGEVIGVINGDAARATLFSDGTAKVYFWKTGKRLSAKWTRA